MTWGYAPLVLETISEALMAFFRYDILDENAVTHTLDVKKGDLEPDVPVQVFEGGLIKDLTGATVVFSMRNVETNVLKVTNAAATLVDANAGTIEYSWAAADVDTEGIFEAEFKVTIGSEPLRVPNGRNHKLFIRVNKVVSP